MNAWLLSTSSSISASPASSARPSFGLTRPCCLSRGSSIDEKATLSSSGFAGGSMTSAKC
jgi:hypothetical protein